MTVVAPDDVLACAEIHLEMHRLLYFGLLFLIFSCEGQKAQSSLIGTYEAEDVTFLIGSHPYDRIIVGENKIAHYMGATGFRHNSWNGLYVRKDSLLDILVYFNFYVDGNIGTTSVSTRQRRLQLTVSNDGDNNLLIRKNKRLPYDTLPNISFSKPAIEAYRRVVDTVGFHPLPIYNCEEYGFNRMKLPGMKKHGQGATHTAEQAIIDLLAEYLNSTIENFTTESNGERIVTASALLKMNPLADFPLPAVTIIDNHTEYATAKLKGLLESFTARNLQEFKHPNLQDFLLVVIGVNEEGICVMPPDHAGLWIED